MKFRTKIICGRFGSAEGAEAFLNFKRIIHNFVNPYHFLKGKTPAEAAEIKLPRGGTCY